MEPQYKLHGKPIDVDNVHKNIDGICHRGSGKTVTQIMLMMGEAELCLPNQRYVYIGEHTRHARDVMHDFASVLSSVGAVFEMHFHTNTIVLDNKSEFRFMGVGTLSNEWQRGNRYDKGFIDVTWEMELVHAERLAQARTVIYETVTI